jgi:hypothetical protein
MYLTWLAILVFLGPGLLSAQAAPILTGDVTKDFPTTNPDVNITPVSNSALNIGQASWITANNWISGWSIQDIRTYYDKSSDTLFVGVNTFANPSGVHAPFGQANGDPRARPTGYDPANMAGDKSVAVAFAPINPDKLTQPGTPLVMAGVPANKTMAGKGTDGFTVSQYNPSQVGLAYQFGKQLPQFTGDMANPTPDAPQLEFTVKNFSKIPGLNPANGFWMAAYAGSAQDEVAGEAYLTWTKVPENAAQNIPEPASLLAWTVALGAVAYRAIRRSRACA